MLYMNTKDVEKIGINWNDTIDMIEQAVTTLDTGDFNQPIKPYLRYRDKSNRIIAMPAFLGGDTNMAGIKWIASFPKNIEQGIQRAHSMTILNDAAIGKPVAAFNTAIVSGIRTASVTGLMIRYFEKVRPLQNATVGILGFGPIGQLHLQMVADQLSDRLDKVLLFDIKGVKTELIPESIKDRVVLATSWEEVYDASDVFITCTVSPEGYIARKPKDKALLLNVSLRDFKPEILDFTSAIIVDEWEEVCRENTDIELMHKQRGLQEQDTKSIADVVVRNAMGSYKPDDVILFNPMGMAIFDIAIATYYYRTALATGVGQMLED